VAKQPISLNLAYIVHRLLTNPRGWRVDDLRRELGIAERTYRKYRRILREEFTPFVGRDGKPVVEEVEDGDVRYLRLVDGDQMGISDPEFETQAAAVYLARSLIADEAGPALSEAIEHIVDEFEHRLRDRPFVLRNVLGHVDRMFVHASSPCDSVASDVMVQLVRALLHRRVVRLVMTDREEHELRPLTLALTDSGPVIVGRPSSDSPCEKIPVEQVADVVVTAGRFEYPSRVSYDPFTVLGTGSE
jgi:hypothetical protein